jgi:cysteine synthase
VEPTVVSIDSSAMAAPRPVDTILETIGGTPCVRLSRVTEPGTAAVFAKLEQLNPAGSLKDRIAQAMIVAAEKAGQLKPGGVVIEPTSGNTGIGLALVCAVKGYRLILTMPETASLERRALLKAYGAELVLTPAQADMDGAVAKAHELVAQMPGAHMPSQFENPANPQSHEETTAVELLKTMAADGGRVDVVVVSVGTGGSLTGIGRKLKQAYPQARLIAVEPSRSPVLSGGTARVHRIQGIGAGFVPKTLDRSFIDGIETVGDEDAWRMKARLGKEEGLLVGISSGANVCVALKLARKLPPEARIYTLLCDSGERYFSLKEQFR